MAAVRPSAHPSALMPLVVQPGAAMPSAPSPAPAEPLPPRGRRGHGRTTLQQVAEAAGVTKITVSRYLRQPGSVAAGTAARIEQALAATGYVANKQAGMLASGRAGMVAAIVPSLANSVFAETVQGLSEGLQPAGYELMLASSGYAPQREEEQIRAVLGWLPDALAVVGHHHTPAALAMLRAAVRAGTPVIELWDCQAEGGEFMQIGFDHAAVGRAMARQLLDAGHRRLAYVDTGVAEDLRAHERGKAFAAAVAEAAARVGATRSARQRQAPSLLAITAPPGDAFDAGRAALHQVLGAGRRLAASGVEAVAFANDHLACGALLEAQRLGLAVPQQLALLGFGDFPLGRQLVPGLSTLRPPRYEIGAAAARTMIELLASPARTPPHHQPLSWSLVLRGSTLPG